MVTGGKDFRRTYSAQLTFLPKCAIIGGMVALVNPVIFAELVAQKPLNKAEQRFVDCMTGKERCAEDNLCVIGNARPQEPIEKGDNANVIRADLIRFFAWGGDETRRIQGNVIGLMGALVPDVLKLNQVPSPYALVLAHCHFTCSDIPIMVSHAEFRFLALTGSLLKGGLSGVGAKIASDMLMDDEFVSEQTVLLHNAQIGGKVICDGGEFNGPDYSLNAQGIRVNGDFTMGKDFVANGEVNLTGADVGGNLDCRNGEFNNEEGTAIAADKIRVRGDVGMSDKFYAKGEVRMIDANIGGALQCDGGEFINTQKAAFCADGMKVSGNVFMREPFFADGEVLLRNAVIGGNWYCGGGRFANKGGKAITADNVQVTGGVFLRSGFFAEGVVWLPDANIKGNLFCDDGVFRNETDMSLTIVRADIGGDVRCDGSNFIGHFNAGGAKIKGTLGWKKIEGHGAVNLDSASAGVLDDDKESRGKFHFILDGFSYTRFANPANAESRIKWLSSRPTKMSFSPQPFEQAAKVLFATGHNHDGREVLLAKERLLTKHGKLPLWHKYFWRPLWHALAGYGYRLLWTLVWSVMFIAVGRALFDFADYSCRIAPHQPVVMALDMKYQPMRPGEECTDARRPTNVMAREYPDYPRFDALAFSLDVFIPVFALHQESHWYPQQQEGDTNFFLRWLRLWYWIQIGAGWILTSLLVLTITGLLRPRQSPGDKE